MLMCLLTGMFLYILLVGAYPYGEQGHTFRQYLCIEKDGVVYPEDNEVVQEVSAELRDFILKMFQYNSEDRMSIDDALHHPWIRDPPNKFLTNMHRRLSQLYQKYMKPLPFFIYDDLLQN